jgi:hypothetical protein
LRFKSIETDLSRPNSGSTRFPLSFKRGSSEKQSEISGASPLGRPIEKVGLFALFVPDKQPSMPAAADPPTAVADLPHLLWIAVPMPPELSVGADLNGVHAFGN